MDRVSGLRGSLTQDPPCSPPPPQTLHCVCPESEGSAEVPVKVLKGHALTRDLGVLDVAFHPTQPWVFSSGADGTLRLFT